MKRERSLLEAERKELRSRRTRSARDAEKQLTELRQQVAEERQRYESAWSRVLTNERKMRELDARLETTPAVEEGSPTGLGRLQRELGLEEADELSDAEQVERVFTVAADRIVASSRVRRTRGPFFLEDGTRVEGTIVRVGAVAAAGVDPSGRGGVLVPVRDTDGTFQVLQSGGDAVEAFLAGEAQHLPLLAYDPRNPPDPSEIELESADEEVVEARTWRDTVDDAAPVGYVILALGLLALLVVLVRLVGLGRLTIVESRAGKKLLSLMHEQHDERELGDLRSYAREQDTALSRVTLQALSHRTLPLELYENSIQASLIMEIGRVGRGLSALRAIAAVSPLLGLLGTVIGMIETFEVLTIAGSASDPQALSGGIAQALATTQLGLVVAVPALLAYSVLRGWASRMETYIEHIAVEISTHIRELSLVGEGHHSHHEHHDHDDASDAHGGDDDHEEAS